MTNRREEFNVGDVFGEECYLFTEMAQQWATSKMQKNLKSAKELLHVYAYHSRFSHAEAYSLCSISAIWPEFCFHPMGKDRILNFEYLNTTRNKGSLPQRFEAWVRENRLMICQGVAQALAIHWSEIEKPLTDNR